MTESLKQLRLQATKELSAVSTLEQLDEFVLNYFGRKQGQLTHVLRSLKVMDESQRKILGKEANDVKIEIWRLIDDKRNSIKKAGKKEFIDLTIDGDKPQLGHLHPVTQIRREVESIFRSLGFAVMEGPEIESDYYNFEALNIPKDHPARDMFDTFYVNNSSNMVLRTHTSPMQARIMENHKPPFSVIVPGRVFRHEATDARHEHTFDQIEGLVVGENISMANLKWTLDTLVKKLFGDEIETQYRPSYFPFTEPSVEILMSCIFCGKKGCSICGRSGWLEVLGAGMVHPKVFEYAGYPKDKYTGFAFGLGILRFAMLKYNIPDIRMFHQNDVRFLHQF
ncbi:MAG TPA: phenylalanine--tRNA ligase subunit alpha [Patescibacteria group bacterium]